MAIVVFLATASAATWAALSPAERFEATAVVSVQPAATNVSTQSIEYLIPSIEERVSSAAFGEEVSARLPAGYRTAHWSVSTSVTPGSGVLRISVSSTARKVPVTVVNAYASNLTRPKLSTIPVEVLVINPAAEVVSLSRRTSILVSGYVLAVILAALAALARLSWAETPAHFRIEAIDGYSASAAARAAAARNVRRRMAVRGSQDHG